MSQFYYFIPCCGEEPFGIINNSNPLTLWPNFTDTEDSLYGLIIDSYSGCVTYSGSTTVPLEDLSFFNSTPIFSIYDNCFFCTNYIFPCLPQNKNEPPILDNTRNECDVITILPMSVECVLTHPSSYSSEDGSVSVSISGGSAPYTVTWSEGTISQTLSPIGNGSYTATTVDYWGDFTATTICTICTPKDCVFSGSIEEIFPPDCVHTGLAGYTFDLT